MLTDANKTEASCEGDYDREASTLRAEELVFYNYLYIVLVYGCVYVRVYVCAN